MRIKHIHPPTNNTSGCTLGNTSLYWKNVYSATFTGDTFTGNAASATKVYVTDTTPTTKTAYYLTYVTGRDGNQSLRGNEDLYYVDTGTESHLGVGSKGHRGQLTLWSSAADGYYVSLFPTTLS